MDEIERRSIKKGLGQPYCNTCGKKLRQEDRKIVESEKGKPVLAVKCTNPKCKVFNRIKKYSLGNGEF